MGAIRQGLNEALVGLQGATVTAGSEGRALGNSLQANVQNVIADVDARFAHRLDHTVDKLTGAERQFMTDARELIFRTRAASTALAAVVGDESRRTIGEADIAAYNASYSLPCRTQAPRVVYSLPSRAVAKGEEIVVAIHGNFLNIGKAASVLVDGKPTTRFTRSDRTLSVMLPKEMIQQVTDTTSVAVTVRGLERRELRPRALSWLFGCKETFEKVQDSSVAVALEPRLRYRVRGEVWATYKTWSSPFVHQRETFNRRSDNCDHDENISFTACVPPGQMRVVEGRYNIKSKSGPSGFGPATLSGSSCILFSGRLKGSGYDWILGVKNCKGSAWLDVDWEVVAERLEGKETERVRFDETLSIGQYSYALNAARVPLGEDWHWRFITTIEQMKGSQVLSSENLTDGRLDNGNGWIANMNDGVLTITLPSDAH